MSGFMKGLLLGAGIGCYIIWLLPHWWTCTLFNVSKDTMLIVDTLFGIKAMICFAGVGIIASLSKSREDKG